MGIFRKAYLTEVVETIDMYNIRKIKWAAFKLYQEGEQISPHKILYKVSLRKNDISIVVNNELQALIEFLNHQRGDDLVAVSKELFSQI